MAEPPPGWCADYVVLTAHAAPVPSAARVLTTDRARAELSDRYWRLLQEPAFEVRLVPSYPAPAFGLTTDSVPVIDTRSGPVVWRYDDDLLWSSSVAHQRALRALRQALAAAGTNVAVPSHSSVAVALFAVATARSGLWGRVSPTLVCVPSSRSRFATVDDLAAGDVPSPHVATCGCGSSAVE